MYTTIFPYLIVCPLVFLAGFIDAIAGGGGLISLPAYMIVGLPAHIAIGTNKLSAAMGTALATYRFGKSGYIKLKLALICAGFAIIGSTIGANIALLINEDMFKIIMLVILPLTAFYLIRSKNFDKSNETKPYSYTKTIALSLPISFVVGIYDGFYGPGTGTFLLLLFTGLAHMSLNMAAGTTKAINLVTNVTAIVVFILNGTILYSLGIVAGLFSIAGNYIGTKYFSKKGAKFVKPVIIVVLSIFFIKVCTEIFI